MSAQARANLAVKEVEAADGVKPHNEGEEAKALHVKEERNIGHVGKGVYAYYFKMAGPGLFGIAAFFVALQIYLPTGATFVLGLWGEEVRASARDERDELLCCLVVSGGLFVCLSICLFV